MAKKGDNLIDFNRRKASMNFNIGMMIFAMIFFYLVVTVYPYMTREKIQFYEVTDGSIVDDKSYTGVILRAESTQYADSAGSIHYYVREGKRVSVGMNIYSMDERGTVSAAMEEQNQGAGALTDRDVLELRKELNGYALSYSDERFDEVYNARYSLEAMAMEFVNFNTLDSESQMAAQADNNFRQITAPVSGVVSYGIDNYETLTTAQINEAVFDRSQYAKAITRAGQWVEPGTPIYKVVTEDPWSIVFQVTDEEGVLFSSLGTLKISFPARNLTATGTFSLVTGGDGKAYGRIDLHKYMVQFSSDRYVDFKILTSVTQGLKIPISSVTTKNFFLVPMEFLTKGGDGLEDGFNKEVYSEAGTSVVFVPVTIYFGNEEFYYIDCEGEASIRAGDYLVRPDSLERFQVGITASLQGAYNINKGYAVFRQIEVLAQSDEFYTIRENMSYGLNVYDHIVLNASVIEDEGALIYQ